VETPGRFSIPEAAVRPGRGPQYGKPNSLTLGHAILITVASLFGGALNAIAGGGSFISFPALLITGIPPIPANATNTIAM